MDPVIASIRSHIAHSPPTTSKLWFCGVGFREASGFRYQDLGSKF